MEYLTTTEFAELKGCTVQYARRYFKNNSNTIFQIDERNNRPQSLLPVSALPVALRERYYSGSGLQLKAAPEGAEMPPALVNASAAPAVSPAPAVVTAQSPKRQSKVIKLKRGIETFSADEREVITFWCELLRDWRVKRQGYDSLEEGDMVYIAETKRLRKEFLTAHGISLSRDIMYRKYKHFKDNDWEGLCEARGGHNRGYNSIPSELEKVFFDLYLRESQPTVSNCYRLTHQWAVDNRPDLAGAMPSENSFRRLIKTIPQAVITYFRLGEKACRDDCLPYIIRLYDSIEANDVWVADNHTLDIITRTDDGKRLHRTHITGILDAKSEALVGWNITENPCSQSTVLALRHAIMRCGVPTYFYVDNGREFLTHDIGGKGHRARKSQENVTDPITILDRLGIEMVNALVENGRAKPIERMFLTLKNTISRITTTFTGGNIIERPESLPWLLKHGYVPTDSQIREALDILLDGYNASPYGGCEKKYKGMTRAEVWCESIKRRTLKMCDEGTLNLLLMRSTRFQTVRENGVYIIVGGEKLWYNSGEDNWRYVGKKVYVRYDPAELDKVRVYDEDDRYIADWYIDKSVFVDYITTETEDVANRQRLIGHQLKALRNMGSELTGEMQIDALALACADAHRKTGNVKLAPPEDVDIEMLTVSEKEQLPMAVGDTDGGEVDWNKIADNAMKRKENNEEV